jgi:hypothetical protein
MSDFTAQREALHLVSDAASLHKKAMEESIATATASSMSESFKHARQSYIRRLDLAISMVNLLRFDESLTISEKVSDLNLEDSVDLLHAVEDHIRSLRRTARSNFS